MKIAIIWLNNKKIGYCHTIFEADDICKKNSNYSWSLENYNKKNLDLLKFMSINDYKSEKELY